MRRALLCSTLAPVLLIACTADSPVTAQGERSGGPAPTDRGGAAEAEQAPDVYRAKFETTEGDFVIEVHRDWAPRGADRFYELVKGGYYDQAKFFRVAPGFVVQWGMHADPEVNRKWNRRTFLDDPVKESNQKGTITFATSGKNSRTTQVFVNLKDNSRLDEMGFSPIGRVVEGMDVVESLYDGYGEEVTDKQGRIAAEGNKYLEREYPELDGIKSATIVEDEKPEEPKE